MAASQCQVHGGRIGFGSRPTAPAFSAAGFVRVEGAAGCCYGASASAVVVGGGLGGTFVASSSSSSGIGVVVLVVSPASPPPRAEAAATAEAAAAAAAAAAMVAAAAATLRGRPGRARQSTVAAQPSKRSPLSCAPVSDVHGRLNLHGRAPDLQHMLR